MRSTVGVAMSSVVIITIGVVFIFLIFSIAVSAINEGIASLLAVRAKLLWTALASFTRAETDAERKKPAVSLGRFLKFFVPRSNPDKAAGPPDTAAGRGAAFVDLVEAKTRRFATGDSVKKVKYVSARVISQALIEFGAPSASGGNGGVGEAGNNDGILQQVEAAVAGTQLESAVKAARARAQGDIEKFAAAIEEWFDARMDALSRLYKSWTRWIMLVIALFIAFIVDVNPIVAVGLLRHDSALAATTADAAAAFVEKTGATLDACPTITKTTEPASTDTSATTTTTAPATTTTTTPLDRVKTCYAATQDAFSQSRDLPPPLNLDHAFKGDEPTWQYIVGCLLGAIAISFGAPFWYDVLRKIISLRS